jgi:hypothetical protein
MRADVCRLIAAVGLLAAMGGCGDTVVEGPEELAESISQELVSYPTSGGTQVRTGHLFPVAGEVDYVITGSKVKVYRPGLGTARSPSRPQASRSRPRAEPDRLR